MQRTLKDFTFEDYLAYDDGKFKKLKESLVNLFRF
jgi:hypothetical protein